MTMPRKDHVGQRFGRLVIKESYAEKRYNWFHLMRCDCGNEKMVSGSDLRKGSVSSCGCYWHEATTKHGMCKSSEYRTWSGIIQRCNNENAGHYNNYGGRGITVCDEWLDFAEFFHDMGKKPHKNYTIERIDNDKGYSKENCIWADRFAQNINQRVRKDNKTGCKGVSYRKDIGKYIVNINRNNKRHYLGAFNDIEDAIAVRLEAENERY